MAHNVEADGAEKNFFGKKDKNMKIKKLLAGIMSAVMVLGIMTFPTFAEETTNEFNIGTNQTYTKLSDAITAASDKGYAEVTYNIYGKVVADEGVDATNNVWLNVIGASDTTVKKINFVGKSEDAELNISQRKVVLALNGGSASADVSYTDLKLSKGECTGTNVQDLGHAANYFTTWLRCGDSANRTVTYTNCTFPNGSSNNQYGKTVYNNCTFNKDNDEQYALWVYTAAKDGVTLGGAVEINGGEMKAARGVKTYSENSADAVANVTLKNIKIETTVKPAVVSSIAGNISFNNVTANKGLIYAECVNSAKNLAEVKINGNSVNYAAKVGNKYYVSVDDAKKNVTDESTIEIIAYAKVGETEYATLTEAAGAIKAGETLTLLDDVTVTGTVNFIKKNNIVFDGANHKISYNNAINGIWFDNCSGITVKDATFDGTSVYGIVFDGGTNKKLINVKMSGDYTFAFMNLSTGGATLENCELSNNNTGKIVNGYFASSVWANVDSAKGKDMLSLINSKVDGITINGYDRNRRNYLMPKIDVGTGSETEIYTYDDSDYSKTRLLCVSPDSEGTYSVYQITDETTGTISEALTPVAKAEVKVDILNSEGKVTEQYDSTVFYETLAGAIEAAKNGGKVTLLCDTTESVEIGADKEITLDLNGKTLTNVGKEHTITNNGKLTVTDSSASKSGAVDNVSHGKAALFNAEGATAELNGGKFMRSAETGIDQDTSGGNSYYTIQNLGNMGINSGVTVENSGKYSSMITNGYYDISKIKDPKAAILTISGGNFRGGLWAVKNDDMAVMKINDGYFESHGLGAFLNNNVVEINGGTFVTDADKPVLRNVYYNNTYNLGTAKITNGNFTGKFVNVKPQGNISISGGTFSTDVSEYCVDGFKAVKGADGKYTIEEANWGKYTDSGCYVVNDTKYGMMRFMFAFTGDMDGKTIQSYGIKYISAENIGAELNENGAVSQSGNYTAFQGDIVGIDYDTTNKANYYAAAYIKFDDNTVIWSAPQKCKINWNRTFTKYAPQTSENGGNE